MPSFSKNPFLAPLIVSTEIQNIKVCIKYDLKHCSCVHKRPKDKEIAYMK